MPARRCASCWAARSRTARFRQSSSGIKKPALLPAPVFLWCGSGQNGRAGSTDQVVNKHNRHRNRSYEPQQNVPQGKGSSTHGQIALQRLLGYKPAHENGGQHAGQRQHDVGGEVVQQVEDGLAFKRCKHTQRRNVSPHVERQNRSNAQQLAGTTGYNGAAHTAQTGFFLNPLNHRLQQGNARGPGSKQQQNEEKGAEQTTHRHVTERQRQGLENQAGAGTGFQTVGKHHREDSKARQQGDHGIQNGDTDSRAPDFDVVTQVGTVGHHNGHTQTQGKERVAQSHQDTVNRQGREVRVEQEADRLTEVSGGGGITHHNQQENEQRRHQNSHRALKAAFQTTGNYQHHQCHKHRVPEQQQTGAAQQATKQGAYRVCGTTGEVSHGSIANVGGGPAADHRVERQDDKCREHPDDGRNTPAG